MATMLDVNSVADKIDFLFGLKRVSSVGQVKPHAYHITCAGGEILITHHSADRAYLIAMTAGDEEYSDVRLIEADWAGGEKRGPKPKVKRGCGFGDYVWRINVAKGGLEVSFGKRPDEETLKNLKAYGFRWSHAKGLWYAKHSPAVVVWLQDNPKFHQVIGVE